METPGTFTRAQLLRHLQVTAKELHARMQEGQLPMPLWGVSPDDLRARWSRAAVERALDTPHGPGATVEGAERLLDRALGLR
jgi:hypothetical protein